MGIFRYIVCLLIGSVLSSLCYLLLRDAPIVIFALVESGAGDPKLTASLISSAIINSILSIPVLVLVGYLVWRLVSWIYLKPKGRQKLRRYMMAGILTHSLMFGVLTGLYLLSSSGFNFSNLVFQVLATITAGCVWGLVFWKADPRSSNSSYHIVEQF